MIQFFSKYSDIAEHMYLRSYSLEPEGLCVKTFYSMFEMALSFSSTTPFSRNSLRIFTFQVFWKQLTVVTFIPFNLHRRRPLFSITPATWMQPYTPGAGNLRFLNMQSVALWKMYQETSKIYYKFVSFLFLCLIKQYTILNNTCICIKNDNCNVII